MEADRLQTEYLGYLYLFKDKLRYGWQKKETYMIPRIPLAANVANAIMRLLCGCLFITVFPSGSFSAETAGLDRLPVPGRNLPYSPADGGTAINNPPPLLWLPAEKPELVRCYHVQLSRNSDFSAKGRIEASTPYLMWIPEQTLEPGEWFWRYGVEHADGKIEWSKTRRFLIPKDAAMFPFPPASQFKISDASPRLLFNADLLKKIRRQIASGALKEMTDQLVAQVHACAGKDLVEEPEWLPPRDSSAFGRYYSATLIATRPDMDKMSDAALAYLLTGDRECGQEARRRILHFFKWAPDGASSLAHNDEPAMWLMMRGCRAYDWTRELFTAEERKKIEHNMMVRAQDFYDQLRKRPFENHPFVSHDGRIVGILGEAAIALSGTYPEKTSEWLRYVTGIYWSVYPAWGREDGGWNEGPGYWQAYMEIALHFVLALRTATGIDLTRRPFFANTAYYRFYLTPPGSRMMPFGDGRQYTPPGKTNVVYFFSSLLQDPYLRWHAENSPLKSLGGVLGYLLFDDQLKAKVPESLPLARYFPGVGLVSSHSTLAGRGENVGFHFHSSPYGGVSHGHNDQNCFVLEAYGEALAVPSGEYDYYGSPHHHGWTQQTKAKCGITYDGGIGQKRGWTAQGGIAGFSHSEHFDLIRGDAGKAYGGDLDRALRDVVRVRPDIFVIRDSIAGKKEHRYEFLLHALDPMEIDSKAQVVTVVRPKASLEVRFLVPKNLVFRQSDEYRPKPEARDYKNIWHLTAQADPAKAVEFLSVLLPYRKGNRESLPVTRYLESPTALGVELKWADGSRCIVGFATPDANPPYGLDGISFDTGIHAIRWNPDGTVAAVSSPDFLK